MKRRLLKAVATCCLILGMYIFVESAHAATVELHFDSLPTQQGWSYQGEIPEAVAASVDGTKLTINTMNQGAVSAFFYMPDIVDLNRPFTLSVRARVVQSETNWWPFDFQARHGFEVWAANLGQTTINLPSQATIPIDGTVFHDFLIDATPGIKSDFYIDGILVESVTPFISNVSGYLIAFGDGNAVPSDSSNGIIEISRFSFSQPVPVPAAIWLLSSGLAGLICLKHKKNRLNSV